MTQGVISLTNRYWLLQVKSLWKREEPIISLKTTTKTCILSVLTGPVVQRTISFRSERELETPKVDGEDGYFTVVTQVRILSGLQNKDILRDRAEVARKAHNLEVIGSIPIPATKIYTSESVSYYFWINYYQCVCSFCF